MTGNEPLIVHVVFRFDVGGLENGVVNLINGLPPGSFRHMVVALTECTENFCRRIERPDVAFVSLHKGPGHGYRLYPRLLRLFRQHRPAIVHTRNLAALEAAVPALAAGVPVRIHGEHGWDVGDLSGQNNKNRWIRRLYAPFVSHYVALSGQIETYLQQRVGISAGRIERICNGVDTARFRPADDRAAPPEMPFDPARHRLIGTVGRLQPVKDQRALLEAFAAVVSRNPEASEWRLVIVGDGPLRESLECRARALGVDDLLWMAGQRDDVAELMRRFDLFVLPSIAEGISNTVLEAMASGVAVIATDVGGNRELVDDGVCGTLVAPSDVAGLADAIEAYMKDSRAREAAGIAARNRVEQRFSIERAVGDYCSLYRRLLGAQDCLRASA
ncbi:MAG: TIGR03088 family PEP-CTERM/XrtA system glycosyltransferase [Rhodocyclaceae bacterium]|nr:TIGR03088 family PEP-CTERM/XrtA system glycosyltransferase [Rhodocyclaceae bacterium]